MGTDNRSRAIQIGPSVRDWPECRCMALRIMRSLPFRGNQFSSVGNRAGSATLLEAAENLLVELIFSRRHRSGRFVVAERGIDHRVLGVEIIGVMHDHGLGRPSALSARPIPGGLDAQ